MNTIRDQLFAIAREGAERTQRRAAVIPKDNLDVSEAMSLAMIRIGEASDAVFRAETPEAVRAACADAEAAAGRMLAKIALYRHNGGGK